MGPHWAHMGPHGGRWIGPRPPPGPTKWGPNGAPVKTKPSENLENPTKNHIKADKTF